ncbi:uncharacterized protein LOC131552130 isoform X3 [Onychostoma macrolepis]|uniref:uncharacterized protein LOC131552130 isoform X3 n=1 Tax=Onychostoma macrolepis TaxID=369639 RepID=UPI00272C36D3|nr:uncharacterized protein LOC131552130 isoform X3 [Onychostoma macrolepis]
MPFPPINLHSRISSPRKELFRKKKSRDNVAPPQATFSQRTGDDKESEKDKLSTSWPSANLKQLARSKPTRVPPDPETDSKHSWLSVPKPLATSCESVPRSSSGESSHKYASRTSLAKEEGEQEIHFSLSLTPEAILVIQKRNLEKQMMAKQQKCCASADLRHRRVFPSKRAQGSSSNKSSGPVAKLDGSNDISTIVKISLLNDQYKYDDVEYEEEDGDVDETVMRKSGPSECQRQRRQQSPSKTGPMAMTSAHAVDSDQVLERKRKALLDQRHLETYYRLQRLKDVLSYKHATLLREKVQRQRQEMKLHDSRPREEHREQKLVSLQRARSTLTHDDAYLRCLPKTRYYLVLELQKQLKQLGCLQSRREQEVFRVWTEQHRSTYQLEKQLQAVVMLAEHSSNSSSDVTLEDLLKQKSGSLPKLQITPSDSTAQHKHMPISVRVGGGGVNAFQQQCKQSWGQDETELMFPEVFTREIKVPKFSSLQSTFLEEVSSKMLLMRSHEPPIRSKTIDIKHKMRLMHNLSLSHMADTQRIMAKNGLSLQFTDGFSIKELMEHECPHNIQTQMSRCATEPDFTHLSDKGTSESPESFTESPNTHFSPSLHPVGKNTESPYSSAGDMHLSYTDVPLCVADIYTSHAVKVENCAVKMWTNYT